MNSSVVIQTPSSMVKRLLSKNGKAKLTQFFSTPRFISKHRISRQWLEPIFS